MKKTISKGVFAEVNVTMAIESEFDMSYMGELITENPVNKKKNVQQIFQKRNSESTYALKKFDENTLEVDMKPIDLTRYVTYEFEAL